MLPHGRASSCFAGLASFQRRHLRGRVLVGSPSAVGCQDEWERGVAARLGSAGFASHRRCLASGLPHGLVLAPGAQGSLCGGALTVERDSNRGTENEVT